jgi:hypothetical protein
MDIQKITNNTPMIPPRTTHNGDLLFSLIAI